MKLLAKTMNYFWEELEAFFSGDPWAKICRTVRGHQLGWPVHLRVVTVPMCSIRNIILGQTNTIEYSAVTTSSSVYFATTLLLTVTRHSIR